MGRVKNNLPSTSKSLSQNLPQENKRKTVQRATLSQGSSQYNLEDSDQEDSQSQRSQKSKRASSQHLQVSSEEENQLAGKLIRYLFALDRSKKMINRTRIVKDVLDNNGRCFHQIMKKATHLLSKIFGYKLLEIEKDKYILVNEIENNLPHITPSGVEGAKQVLLFLVLTHIFMEGEVCTEASLWDFLTRLGITSADNKHHNYFGNVGHLINTEFIAQGYLKKIISEKDAEQNNLSKNEFRWGHRAEHEFSRRAALEFVSKMYGGRPMDSWTIQFKALTAKKNQST